MEIRIEHKEYPNFDLMLDDIKNLGILKYFLVVNDEEVEITKNMAFGITEALDEYKREFVKNDKLH